MVAGTVGVLVGVDHVWFPWGVFGFCLTSFIIHGVGGVVYSFFVCWVADAFVRVCVSHPIREGWCWLSGGRVYCRFLCVVFVVAFWLCKQ